MAERRQLRFATLAEVVRDAEALLSKGYDKTGKWDLSQCCRHLAFWMTCPIDGFGKAPLPVRLFLWFARNTFGPGQLKKILSSGFKPGVPTDPKSVPVPGGDEQEAVTRLKLAAERFETHTGAIHPSPFFGPMTKETALQLQLIHAAHHLSFLVPREG